MLIDDDTIDLYVTARLMTKYNFGEKIAEYTSAIKAWFIYRIIRIIILNCLK
jgi:hypothetical protein